MAFTSANTSFRKHPYDEDIHAPLLNDARHPIGRHPEMAANIDLALTILNGGAEGADFVDGRSLMALLQPPTGSDINWRQALLLRWVEWMSPLYLSGLGHR
jgi:hypothetical protein